MNYLISYKIHDFVSPIITTFQVIKSESKIEAVKHLLDNHQETVDIIAISEIDDALTEMIREYYDSEYKSQSSTVAQKIDEAIKAPQKQLSESEARRTLQDLGILDEQSNITAAYEGIVVRSKVGRKLEDYTLKEVKQLCRQQLDCPDCPFYNTDDDECKLGERLPEHWEL